MKICISFLSYGKDVFAGIENSLYNLAAGFAAQHAEVIVYSSYLSGSESIIDVVPIFRSDILPRELPEGNLTIWQCLTERSHEIQDEFCALLTRERVDYAITCDALWGILQVADACKCAPCPVILSLHVVNTPELLKQAAENPYFFRRTVSNILKKQIEQIYPLRDLVVIPNSIDLAKFRPLKNLGRASKIIFCNARINPDKGIAYLLRAFAKFVQTFPTYELWLCNGDFPFGDKPAALREVQAEIGLLGIGKHVQFLPNLSWAQIPEVIRQSFVVVLPTFYESFGRAAVEALACGVPLITSHVGNLPDLVGNAGILVEPRSAHAIYDALLHLVKNEEDYQLLVTRGPQVAANYDNPIIAAQFLEAIRQRHHLLSTSP